MKSHSIAKTRILLVDDHEPFRKFVRTFLGQLDDFQLVGEAGDGLTAVRQCVQLQPDLVLLDIGLPELNGIQVARQIRQLAPDSRIVFLTQESSSAIVHEALSLGAAAYVIKAHTASDLIVAIIAARDGRQFVSSGLDGSIRLNDPPLAVGSKHSIFPPRADSAPHHKVYFYPDDLSFVTGMALCIEKSLQAGKVVLAIATESHGKAIIESVRSSGIDTRSAMEAGRLVVQDTFELLAQFIVGGRVDQDRLLHSSNGLIERLMRQNPGARMTACGACAPVVLDRGDLEGAIRIEQVWDEISLRHDIEVLCGYIFSGLQRPQDVPGYWDICAWHSHAR